jgi:hypothetical protein
VDSVDLWTVWNSQSRSYEEEVLILPTPDMAARDTAKEHGWQLKEAKAPHTAAAGHRDMAPALRGPLWKYSQ